MTLNTRPGINGNSPRDFDHARRDLGYAIEKVDAALRFIRVELTHGRNYASRDARQADLAKLQKAREAMLALIDLHHELPR